MIVCFMAISESFEWLAASLIMWPQKCGAVKGPHQLFKLQKRFPMPTIDPEEEYVLGTDMAEHRRLERQHLAWIEQMHALLRRAGIEDGQSVLDLGTGPGFTAFELANFVGSEGRVLACDVSPRFIASLDQEKKRRGLTQIESKVCSVEELALDDNQLDGAYGRWILSWLPDASIVIDQMSRALRPNGCYVLQEYLDWGRMRLLPENPDFDAGIAGCMESWRVGGGVINVSSLVPEMAARAGLVVEHFEIISRSGRPGSLVWNWLDEFYRGYMPRLVERNLVSESTLAAFLGAWQQAAGSPESIVVAPVMADIVLRKPLA